MTVTHAAPAAAPAVEPPRRRRRRWHRAVIPFAMVLTVLVITAVTYSTEQPDLADPAFLSPVSGEPVGARQLADRLRAKGVTVRRETRTSDALIAAHRGDTTLLIPAPALVHPYYLRMLRTMPTSTRVVLVEPPSRTLSSGRVPVDADGRRWATAVASPGAGCTLPAALDAGPAAVTRQRYGPVDDFFAAPLYRCYDAGLVGFRLANAEVVAVGSADPFRNDRLAEHGNAALLTGLLGAHPTVVWLDLHRREPAPAVLDRPDAVQAPPSLAPGPTVDPAAGAQEPQPPRREPDNPPNPLWRAFPAWFWALLVQLMLAAIALALSRGRRLGPPVVEPLPVTVRATETVLGRGRQYRRAKDPGATLAMLRRVALRRLAARLDPPRGATPDELTNLVVEHSGWPPAEVAELLYGPEPGKDADLVRLAQRLEALVRDASEPAPPGTTDGPIEGWTEGAEQGGTR
jgi:hypothetical protein